MYPWWLRMEVVLLGRGISEGIFSVFSARIAFLSCVVIGITSRGRVTNRGD